MSWRLVELLDSHGIDAVHVRHLGLADASDERVMSAAIEGARVLVTMDSDFARMLAAAHGTRPSILYLRLQARDRPPELAPILVAAIRGHAAALRDGAVVVVSDDGVRVRSLPFDQRT